MVGKLGRPERRECYEQNRSRQGSVEGGTGLERRASDWTGLEAEEVPLGAAGGAVQEALGNPLAVKARPSGGGGEGTEWSLCQSGPLAASSQNWSGLT